MIADAMKSLPGGTIPIRAPRRFGACKCRSEEISCRKRIVPPEQIVALLSKARPGDQLLVRLRLVDRETWSEIASNYGCGVRRVKRRFRAVCGDLCAWMEWAGKAKS